ncbi:leucine-rich repeat protein [Mycoplasma sp. 1458C]|uniref:leucine-rich repeat domain-containing protein n=2 Tax=unclassified Mycoplasma TaxID=2683645 RepID=UPI003AAE987F
MQKVGKFLLITIGGLAIGSAAVAIPSVINKQHLDYKKEQNELKLAEANIKVDLQSRIFKQNTLPYEVNPGDIIFSGYNKSLFDISLVGFIDELVETQLGATTNNYTKENNNHISYLERNNKHGVIKFRYKIQSKKYADLFAIKKARIDGFKRFDPLNPIKKANDLAEKIKIPIMQAYAKVASNVDNRLNKKQIDAINAYGERIANNLADENLALLTIVDKVISDEKLAWTSLLHKDFAVKLNSILTDILQQAISLRSNKKGIEQVKEYLSSTKMSEIKKEFVKLLNNDSNTIVSIIKSLLESLKNDKNAKNITTLDSFILEMTAFFQTKIKEITDKIDGISFNNETTLTIALKKIEDLLPDFKNDVVEKIRKLLPEEIEYNAVKTILEPKYQAIEKQIETNLKLSIVKTNSLANLIDELKLGSESSTVESKNVISFTYNDGKNDTSIKYNVDAKKLVIPDAEIISSDMFQYAFDKLQTIPGIDTDNLTLSCPNAKVIPWKVETNIKITKLELPKIENVIFSNMSNNQKEFNNRITRYLSDDKVVQNGILFKWYDPIGNIDDSSITQIIPYAFNKTDYVRSIKLPNLQRVGNNAFGSVNYRLGVFPKIKGKIILNGILIRWDDSTGEIFDDQITKIAPLTFFGNQKITSVSFPNVTEVGDHAFLNVPNLKTINLPKLHSSSYYSFSETDKMDHKVIINGILVKWDNAEGDLRDDSIIGIANSVFSNNEKITSINFPNVINVGEFAFKAAKNLNSINLPKAKYIRQGAFTGAEKLNEVALPNAEIVESNSFSNITNLQTISLPNVKYISEENFYRTPNLNGKVLFNGCLFKWDNAEGKIFDKEVKIIANDVFKNNTKVTSVSFPNATYIGQNAFANATNLNSINLPSLLVIQNKAFDNTPSLTGKIVLNGILAKWDNAEGDVRDENILKIGPNVFQNNIQITSVSFPNVTSIGTSAFEGATNINSIVVPNLHTIENKAFDNTPSLTGKIVLNGILAKWDNAEGDVRDENILKIGPNVFQNNTKLTSISFPNVTSIGDDAFTHVSGLTYIELPKVKYITQYNQFPNYSNSTLRFIKMDMLKNLDLIWFSNSKNLTTVSFNSLKTIDEKFRNLTSLTFISFNDAIYINEYAFAGTKNLTTVSFPNVIEIGDKAFGGAINLKTAEFPKVKYIGNGAFDNTPKLINKPSVK